MLQTQVELSRVSACSRAKTADSGSTRLGASATHRGRDPAKVNSPALGQQVGCSGRHVIDAIHQRDRCHHPVHVHGGYCRLLQWVIQARLRHCLSHRARLGGYGGSSPQGITEHHRALPLRRSAGQPCAAGLTPGWRCRRGRRAQARWEWRVRAAAWSGPSAARRRSRQTRRRPVRPPPRRAVPWSARSTRTPQSRTERGSPAPPGGRQGPRRSARCRTARQGQGQGQRRWSARNRLTRTGRRHSQGETGPGGGAWQNQPLTPRQGQLRGLSGHQPRQLQHR
jgi:hypothetical protein